jgi:hypothetical protein
MPSLNWLPIFPGRRFTMACLFTIDPGGTPKIVTVSYDISEELSKDSYVGTLPIIQGYIYKIQDQQTLFNLNNNTGVITTQIVIDREVLSHNTQSFFVLGTSYLSLFSIEFFKSFY